MPDSRPVEKLEIRTDISYFDNINSGERVPYPAAEQNSATKRLRRGDSTEKRRFCAARITIRFQQQ